MINLSAALRIFLPEPAAGLGRSRDGLELAYVIIVLSQTSQIVARPGATGQSQKSSPGTWEVLEVTPKIWNRGGQPRMRDSHAVCHMNEWIFNILRQFDGCGGGSMWTARCSPGSFCAPPESITPSGVLIRRRAPRGASTAQLRVGNNEFRVATIRTIQLRHEPFRRAAKPSDFRMPMCRNARHEFQHVHLREESSRRHRALQFRKIVSARLFPNVSAWHARQIHALHHHNNLTSNLL